MPKYVAQTAVIDDGGKWMDNNSIDIWSTRKRKLVLPR